MGQRKTAAALVAMTAASAPTVRDRIAVLVAERGLQPIAELLTTSRNGLSAYLCGRAKKATTFYIEAHAASVLSSEESRS